MGLVKGIHHISIDLFGEKELQRAIHFYRDILGLTLEQAWGEGKNAAALLMAGGTSVELFARSEKPASPNGAIKHIAFAVTNVDACVSAVREAGYPIIMEPRDIMIGNSPSIPARIAFCVGPASEEIEFFCQKE